MHLTRRIADSPPTEKAPRRTAAAVDSARGQRPARGTAEEALPTGAYGSRFDPRQRRGGRVLFRYGAHTGWLGGGYHPRGIC